MTISIPGLNACPFRASPAAPSLPPRTSSSPSRAWGRSAGSWISVPSQTSSAACAPTSSPAARRSRAWPPRPWGGSRRGTPAQRPLWAGFAWRGGVPAGAERVGCRQLYVPQILADITSNQQQRYLMLRCLKEVDCRLLRLLIYLPAESGFALQRLFFSRFWIELPSGQQFLVQDPKPNRNRRKCLVITYCCPPFTHT